MNLPLVIANPKSASGATGDAWPGIASKLRSHFGPFRVAFTEKRGDAGTLAASGARKGTPMIIACGGDGTISEVANGILNSGKDVELGIIPSGTGGDFRKTLEIPARARDAALVLREGKTRAIDVGKVTFVDHGDGEASRYFLGVASLGMSVTVVRRTKESGPDWLTKHGPAWLSGRMAFAASTVRTAIEAPVFRVVVQLDEEREQRLKVVNLCVANARYFGGGMKIAPDAILNDGLFDVISVGDVGALKIITNAPRLYLGSHLGMDQVGHSRAKKLVVRSADENVKVALEVDGELPGRLPATFQVVPAALRIRCPK